MPSLHAAGRFETSHHPLPALLEEPGATLGLMRVDKAFTGELVGKSSVWMSYHRSETDPACATYVALERIQARIGERSGSFVVAHLGLRGPGLESLELPIAAGSGTGDLAGISGRMEIVVSEGEHAYRLNAQLP